MHGCNGIKVVFEDEALLVVDKPSGILVVPDFKKQSPTLTDLLNKELVLGKKQCRLYPCHRLDRETSGLVIFSKGKKNRQIIMQQFRLKKVIKRYIALVHGRLKNNVGTIKSYISSSFKASGRTFKKNPKLAITKYRLIRSGADFSAVEVMPVTGRTNQIRIHFKEIGHPLLGERKYAFGKDFALKFRRLALHAAGISFFHPENNKRIDLTSALPKDMSDFVASRLGGFKI